MDALESLLGNSQGSSGFFDPAQLLAPLMPFIILISIVSVLIGVLYVINVITTFRSHRATIETRDILREMNERDKARSLPDAPREAYAATDSSSSATGKS